MTEVLNMFTFLQAKLLNTMCGATVKFSVISESGRLTSASFPSIKVRHLGLQAGQSVGAVTRNHTNHPGTPKKTPAKLLKKIADMPSKKEKQINTTDLTVNKRAIFNSVQKKNGLQGVWLGCEAEIVHSGTMQYVPMFMFKKNDPFNQTPWMPSQRPIMPQKCSIYICHSEC
jgi:hypothetical protein